MTQGNRKPEGTNPRFSARRVLLCAGLAVVALATGACGGDDEENPPPPAKVTGPLFDISDPCDAKIPTPTDLFRDETGLTELTSCAPPTDPIDAAIAEALADEGASVATAISIPFGGSIDATTLTSTGTFVLIPGAGTASTGVSLPPTILLEQTSGSTTASGWSLVAHRAEVQGSEIKLIPNERLRFGTYYVAVLTTAIKDDERPQKSIAGSELIKLLVASAPVAAGGSLGLDTATAERLERERQRLAPAVALLQNALPPVVSESVASIQGFTTERGFERVRDVFRKYHFEVANGRYGYSVTTSGGDIPPADIFPGLPPVAYDHIQAFRRGVIKAPRFVGDDLRMRPDWDKVKQEVDVPFLMSIPQGVSSYPVIVFIPGYGRGSIDARSIANEFGTGPQAAVMAIDLRCHGARTRGTDGICKENRSAAEVAMLTDAVPNNGNPEIAGADMIPDDSGKGFFPGDAQALRDTQIAAALEIAHILEALRDRTAFTTAGINPEVNEIHLIAQGHSAPAALLALALTNAAPKTAQFPSGGAGIADLILNGPADLYAGFQASLPAGVGNDRAQEYLNKVETLVLSAVAATDSAPLAAARYSVGATVRRMLLNHGSAATPYVSATARQSLIDALTLPTNRVSRHNGQCDDFFIFTCRLGDTNTWVTEARRQIVTFVDSGGVTVTAPAQ